MQARSYNKYKVGKYAPKDAVLATANRAASAVFRSLAEAEIEGSVVYSHDDRGMRFDVAVKSADLPRAREWLESFGRSYGPIRIFLRVCHE